MKILTRPEQINSQKLTTVPAILTCPSFLQTGEAACITSIGPCSDFIKSPSLLVPFQSNAEKNSGHPCSMDQSRPPSIVIYPARFALAETAPLIAGARPHLPPEQALAAELRAPWVHSSETASLSETAGDAAIPRRPIPRRPTGSGWSVAIASRPTIDGQHTSATLASRHVDDHPALIQSGS
jgi:hypothetical protein